MTRNKKNTLHPKGCEFVDEKGGSGRSKIQQRKKKQEERDFAKYGAGLSSEDTPTGRSGTVIKKTRGWSSEGKAFNAKEKRGGPKWAGCLVE